jgi:predicted 3-demethylubiquinone-9 3-methyltransferase (glyoxalase superfamily)
MSKTEIRTRICLWYNGDAEEAFEFYARTFPDTKVEAIDYAPSDYPDGRKGDALVVTATVVGIPTIGLNGGDQFPQSEAFSFQVITEDQAETDRLWNAVVGNGGAESMCGWCKDKWGLNWQITPRVLLEAQQGDPAKAKRVFEAMMTMKKIDVAGIEAAAKG